MTNHEHHSLIFSRHRAGRLQLNLFGTSKRVAVTGLAVNSHVTKSMWPVPAIWLSDIVLYPSPASHSLTLNRPRLLEKLNAVHVQQIATLNRKAGLGLEAECCIILPLRPAAALLTTPLQAELHGNHCNSPLGGILATYFALVFAHAIFHAFFFRCTALPVSRQIEGCRASSQSTECLFLFPWGLVGVLKRHF